MDASAVGKAAKLERICCSLLIPTIPPRQGGTVTEPNLGGFDVARPELLPLGRVQRHDAVSVHDTDVLAMAGGRGGAVAGAAAATKLPTSLATATASKLPFPATRLGSLDVRVPLPPQHLAVRTTNAQQLRWVRHDIQALEIMPSSLPPDAVSHDLRAFRARVGDPASPRRSLIWELDGRFYSPTELTCKLFREYGVGDSGAKPSCYAHWRVVGAGRSLWDEVRAEPGDHT